MSAHVRGFVALLALALTPALIRAQTAVPSPRAQAIQRAQRLVNDGNGAEGRALMDSLLNATEPRSPDEAEVLYWRAALAESWDQAQRDYLRVMLEHERSVFAASSMLRLAQGELMRGDRDAALRYLERLLAEAPEAAERTEAAALRARIVGVVAASATPPGVPPSSTMPNAGVVWSVQIAAFATAEEAATLVAAAREKGYDARVDGIAPPFRVRFGRYPTRAAASAAMEAYRTKERADAFLTQVPR